MSITLKKGKVTRVIDLIAVFDVALQLLLNKDKYLISLTRNARNQQQIKVNTIFP